MYTNPRAVIIANGILAQSEKVKSRLQPGDRVIAADGGGNLCMQMGILPHILIGDFDSLLPDALAYFEKQGVQILRHDRRKDFTDLELALLHARSLGLQEVLIFAALGARWDQSLANCMLLASSAFSEMHILLIDGHQEIMLIKPGKPVHVQGAPGDTLSLIPLSADAQGITTHGLEYPLQDENLAFGSSRGISNVLMQDSASIGLQAGLLLCVIEHHGSPETNQIQRNEYEI